MKRILFLLILVFTFFSIKAQITQIDTIHYRKNILSSNPANQTPVLYQYSAGLKAFKLEQFPKILDQDNATDFKKVYFNSLFFKINDNQITFRFQGNYYNNKLSFSNQCKDCEISEGTFKDFGVKLGFERMLSYTVIQPYYGFDLGFRKNRFKGSSQSPGPVIFTTPYDGIAEKNGLVFSPVLGLNFNLANHFTLGLEGNLDLLYNYERREKTTLDASRTRSFKSDKGWEFLFTPIALSLQYNFGQND